MEQTGVLIALAYPEEFVTMIPGWYKRPLQWLGLINDNMICAGHSALVLIKKDTGKVEYADFGRYITPIGKGRARTSITDPECTFDVVAKFDKNGKITNIHEILIAVEKDPEVTHGAGRMYASLCYDVNYDKAKNFIQDINFRGSVTYDPFDSNGSNCARFVFDTFKSGIISKSLRSRLILWNKITPSPLGIVFGSTDSSDIYSILEGEVAIFKGKKVSTLFKHFMIKPDGNPVPEMKKIDMADTHHWLDGTGACGWFKLSKPNGKYMFERRLPDGELIFEKEFICNDKEFDIYSPYTLVHDCNAMWCTVRQNGNIYKLSQKDYAHLV